MEQLRKAEKKATEPRLERREKLNYVAICTTVTMQRMATVMQKLMPEVGGWLRAHNVKASGPEFIRYIRIDMAKELDIEVGVPVAKPQIGSGRVKPGVLPAGKYAVLTHFGNYSGLVAPNAEIQEWAKKKCLDWSVTKTKKGDEWAGRAEFYFTDPAMEPDADKWKTDILYLTKETKPKRSRL